MDIVRHASKTSPLRSKWLVGGAIGAGLLVALAYFAATFTAKSINRSTLLIGEVQRGDMQVNVFGNGVLVPKEVRWVASTVAGRVNRILVKPGAYVDAGEVLLELSNPELIQIAEEASWELEASQADMRATEVNLESDILNQQTRIKTVSLNLESARMQYDAEETLVQGGHGSISMLDHRKAQLSVRQLENELLAEQLRLERMQRNREAQLNANAARLKMLRNSQLRAQHNVEALRVSARASGVVQEVSVALGQQLALGASLVKIADQSDLIAELKIPERLVNDVAIGQPAVIDTRSSQIQGLVNRIDPAVIGGAVLVEIHFSEALPKEARPDLRVSGEILVADIKNTLFVERPVLAQSEQQSVVFKLNGSGKTANKTAVHYGRGSATTIQILSGLHIGDKIILSDHSSWEHFEKVALK